jgi:hypothetical protein
LRAVIIMLWVTVFDGLPLLTHFNLVLAVIAAGAIAAEGATMDVVAAPVDEKAQHI